MEVSASDIARFAARRNHLTSFYFVALLHRNSTQMTIKGDVIYCTVPINIMLNFNDQTIPTPILIVITICFIPTSFQYCTVGSS